MKSETRWAPVPAGIVIGISMLLAFIVAGRGIGASGAMTRFVAWVFMMCIFAGGWMAAWFVRKQWI